jgi:hypothetical protein
MMVRSSNMMMTKISFSLGQIPPKINSTKSKSLKLKERRGLAIRERMRNQVKKQTKMKRMRTSPQRDVSKDSDILPHSSKLRANEDNLRFHKT